MEWKKVSVMTTAEGLDFICFKRGEIGITQVEVVEDAASTQRILDETSTWWDYVDAERVLAAREPCVRAYLPANDAGAATLHDLKDMMNSLHRAAEGYLDLGSLKVIVEPVRDEDWANNWKQYYKPMEIGSRLLVKPSWEELGRKTHRIVMQMDPGMVFGTGTHETTQMCLEQLDARIQPDMRVLDLGCGSGILSVAALLLGASEAVGVDIDPNAVDIAYNNAASNGIGRDRYKVVAGNILEDEALVDALGTGYDIVVANIVAGVIIPLSAIVPRFVKKNSFFITSGIITNRVDAVRQALIDNGFAIRAQYSRKDWVAITATYTR